MTTSSLAQRVSRRVVAVVLVLGVLAPSRAALADDAGARQAFKRGVELYDKKQYQPALEQFQKAYAEKPSAVIKQNVALSLKGLGRNTESATAFDEALDEGATELRPETRAAIEQELVELTKKVATIRFTIVGALDRRPFAGAIVSVDGRPLAPAEQRRAVRLDPGIHVFTAHAAGQPDPPEKRLSLLAGSPVDATFEMGTPAGELTITPVTQSGATLNNVPDATVRVDGKQVAKSAMPVRLTAGTHHVTVVAPGFQTTIADVVVSPGASVEYPVALVLPGGAPPPPPYEPTRRTPKPLARPKNFYLVPMLSYEGQSLRCAPILGEPDGGSKHAFTGASVQLRVGYHLTKNFGAELLTEVGQVGATYRLANTPSAASDSSTKVVQLQIAPGLRFTTAGSVRFTTGTYVGLHGQVVTADLITPATTTGGGFSSVKGDGASISWIGDLGMQLDAGPLWVELVGFLDVHGVGTTRDDVTNQRLFYSSPSTRSGVRAGLGIPLF